MKRDNRKRGGALTVTENVHDDVRFSASVAMHSTFVDPTANPDPDEGVHATETGCCPSLADGAGKLIGVVAAPVDAAVIGVGQLTAGGAALTEEGVEGPPACGGAGVGALGLWHPIANNT